MIFFTKRSEKCILYYLFNIEITVFNKMSTKLGPLTHKITPELINGDTFYIIFILKQPNTNLLIEIIAQIIVYYIQNNGIHNLMIQEIVRNYITSYDNYQVISSLNCLHNLTKNNTVFIDFKILPTSSCNYKIIHTQYNMRMFLYGPDQKVDKIIEDIVYNADNERSMIKYVVNTHSNVYNVHQQIKQYYKHKNESIPFITIYIIEKSVDKKMILSSTKETNF